MRGNEVKQQLGAQGPAGFPIPMRGNENETNEEVIYRRVFPIPMRGNESAMSLDESTRAMNTFPIPMRGNEETFGWDWPHIPDVSDPHEG